MRYFSALLFGVLGFALIAPVSVFAATSSFEVAGWLPYWSGATSTADVIPHLSELTEVDLFAYSLTQSGGLYDNAGLTEAPWSTLIADAEAQHVRVIPTIMTSSGSLVHALLSNATSRVALETTIAQMVNSNGYDGVEIDFEGKYAEDKDNFSTFLKGLSMRLGKKYLVCDIEARTPLQDEYYGTSVPAGAGDYANDYTQINNYCDRVKIMTYDQQGIDQQLATQAASSSQLYAPVADPLWVQKVVDLAKQSIAPSKLMIGVPTYGYEYDVTAYSGSEYDYSIMWTFNPKYATQIEQQYGVSPMRNSAGELQLTYFTTASTTTPPISDNNLSALLAASAATAYADSLNSHESFRLLDWPDAASVAQKALLAQQLGVRGIAVFKFDGGEDPNIWNVIKGLAGSPTTIAAAPASTGVSAASSLTRNLGLGSTGADVKLLQQILNSDPATQIAKSGVGSPGSESTYFGAATEAAVKKFQTKYGIATASNPAYGYVGPATRAKLNSLIGTL